MSEPSTDEREASFEEMVAHATDQAEADYELLYRLIEMRRATGLSQRDVAARLGIAQSSVSTFERYDNDPRLSMIRSYALALGASIEHTVRSWSAASSAVDVEGIAVVLAGHRGGGRETDDAEHPWKARCECGTWFYLLENHQAAAVVAYLAGEGRDR